jgi:hypothetical protein
MEKEDNTATCPEHLDTLEQNCTEQVTGYREIK